MGSQTRWQGFMCLVCLVFTSVHAREVADTLGMAHNAIFGAPHGAEVSLKRRHGVWGVSRVWFSTPFLTEAHLEIVTGLTELEELDVSGKSGVSVAGMEKLSKLGQLRRLTLPVGGAGRGLGVLTQLTMLEDLHLVNCSEMRLEDLGVLKDIQNLRRLDAFSLNLDDEAVTRYIKPIARLEELRLLRSEKITDAGVSELRFLARLRSLSLPSLGDRGVAALGTLEHLERLGCRYVPGPGRADLSSLHSVTALNICVPGPVPAASISLPSGLRRLSTDPGTLPKLNLASAPELESVSFSGEGPRKPGDLGWLKAIPRLTEVTIDGGNEEAIAVSGLSRLSALTLAYDCMRVFDEVGAEAVSHLQHLEALDLRAGAASDEAMKTIGMLTGLQRLKLPCSAEVTEHGLGFLGELRNLESLCLDLTLSNAAPVEGLASISGLRHLRALELRLNRDGRDASADRLLPLVKGLKELEELCIWGTLTDAGLAELGDLKALRRLDLRGNRGYTEAGLAALMQSSPNLEEIKLSYLPPTKPAAGPARKPPRKPRTPPAEAP